MKIDPELKPVDLKQSVNRVFELAAPKLRVLDASWDSNRGAPVFTVDGQYTTRGWTDWTAGFQFGCLILIYDGTNEREWLDLGRQRTVDYMLPHVTHRGVHDHGFNCISTYGNLRRLMNEGRIDEDQWEKRFYDTALSCSGAVQAMRWSMTKEGGYVYSFNGPHSLFVDTMRTIRVLGLAHQLGHVLMDEHDQPVNLLGRAMQHGLATARYNIFYGHSDHVYDVRGRTAHEAVFNRNDSRFRCRATQQGYSPFSTWTRGLAWAVLGFSEQLEFLNALQPQDLESALPSEELDRSRLLEVFTNAAKATADHYVDGCSTLDGMVYWDDSAPGLTHLGDWRGQPADPFNDHEPVDSSASAIAAQGLIRLGRFLGGEVGQHYVQAGLSVARTLFDEPYLSMNTDHQGLLLHSVYHRPNGWDFIPPGRRVPCGESSMWGDYHFLELAVLVQRLARQGSYPTFFS